MTAQVVRPPRLNTYPPLREFARVAQSYDKLSRTFTATAQLFTIDKYLTPLQQIVIYRAVEVRQFPARQFCNFAEAFRDVLTIGEMTAAFSLRSRREETTGVEICSHLMLDILNNVVEKSTRNFTESVPINRDESAGMPTQEDVSINRNEPTCTSTHVGASAFVDPATELSRCILDGIIERVQHVRKDTSTQTKTLINPAEAICMSTQTDSPAFVDSTTEICGNIVDDIIASVQHARKDTPTQTNLLINPTEAICMSTQTDSPAFVDPTMELCRGIVDEIITRVLRAPKDAATQTGEPDLSQEDADIISREEGLAVEIGIPPMAKVIVKTPPTGDLIDSFVLNSQLFFVSETAVTAMSMYNSLIDPYREYATPVHQYASDKINRQTADVFLSKKGLHFVEPSKYCIVAYDVETSWRADQTAMFDTVPDVAAVGRADINILGIDMRGSDGFSMKKVIVYVQPARAEKMPATIAKAKAVAEYFRSTYKDIQLSFVATQSAFGVLFREVLDQAAQKYPIVVAMSYNGSASIVGGSFNSRSAPFANGYDLPAILYRMRVEALKSIVSSCHKMSTKKGSAPKAQTCMVNLFGARVHFVDLCDVMTSNSADYERAGKFTTKPRGQKLSDYLSALSLAPKDDIDASTIGPILRSMADPELYAKVAAYCVRDCSALHDINEKVNYVVDMISFAGRLKIPLSAALHRTAVKAVVLGEMFFTHARCPDVTRRAYSLTDMRSYIKMAGITDRDAIMQVLEKYHFGGSYEDFVAPQRKYKGGFNLERKGSIWTDTTVAADYNGMYANILLTYQVCAYSFIGLFTEIQDPDKYLNIKNDPMMDHAAEWVDGKANLIYKFQEGDPLVNDLQGLPKDTVTYLVFQKNIEPNSSADGFLNFVANLLTSRTEIRAQQKVLHENPDIPPAEKKGRLAILECQQNAFKRAGNSLYGSLGTPSISSFVNVWPAVAVTLLGRIGHYAAFRAIQKIGTSCNSDTDSGFFETGWLPQISPEKADTAATDVPIAQRVIGTCPDGTDLTIGAFREGLTRVEKFINDEIRADLLDRFPSIAPRIHRINMPIELPKIMSRGLFPKCSKHYLYLKFDIMTCKSRFASSGLKFATLSQYVERRTLGLFGTLLRGGKDKVDEILGAFILEELARIAANIDDYGFVYRDSREPIPSILEKWPQYAGRRKSMPVIPIVSSAKRTGDAWAPVAELSDELRPDILRTFRLNYGSNIKAFFPSVDKILAGIAAESIPRAINKKTAMAETDFLGDILVRREKLMDDSRVRFDEPERLSLNDAMVRIIKAKPDESFHEYIRPIMRVAFDLDDNSRGNLESQINVITSNISNLAGISVRPTVLRADGPEKTSAHVVFPIIAERHYVKKIATVLAKECPAIDLAIYAPNHSLRLPLVMKLADGQVVNRPFHLAGAGRQATIDVLRETFVSNLRDGAGKKLPMLRSLGELPHVMSDVFNGPYFRAFQEIACGGECPPQIIDLAAEFLKISKDNLVVDARDSYVRLGAVTPVECVICHRTHKKDFYKLYVDGKSSRWSLQCYAVITGRTPGNIPAVSIGPALVANPLQTVIEKLTENPPKFPDKNTEPYVKYDASLTGLTFIRASLGAGKSGCYERHAEKFGTTVMLSSRRTFSSAMRERYDVLGFKDYREVQGDISLAENHRIILQIDSLVRLTLAGQELDLLLLDEIESLQTQMLSIAKQGRSIVADLFCQLISAAKHVLCMDGNLSGATIAAIQSIASQSAEPTSQTVVFQNLPLQGMTVNVTKNSCQTVASTERIAQQMLEMVESGPTVSFCGTYNLAKILADSVASAGKKVLFYNGHDMAVDDGRTMFRKKQEDFAHIGEVLAEVRPDLFLFTSTLTVGVDIQKIAEDFEFVNQFHLFSAAVDPLQQIQATRRVRHTSAMNMRINFAAGSCKNDKLPFDSEKTLLSLGQSFLEEINKNQKCILRNWQAIILDFYHNSGARLIFQKEDSLPRSERIKSNLINEAAEVALTEEAAEAFQKMRGDGREAREMKMKYNNPKSEPLYMKYRIMTHLGMSIPEINALPQNLFVAAKHVMACKADRDMGTEIRKETSLSRKIDRLVLVYMTTPGVESDHKFEKYEPDDDIPRDRLAGILAEHDVRNEVLRKSGVVMAIDTALAATEKGIRKTKLIRAAVNAIANNAMTVGGKLYTQSHTLLPILSKCENPIITLAVHGIALQKFDNGTYRVHGWLADRLLESSNDSSRWPDIFRDTPPKNHMSVDDLVKFTKCKSAAEVGRKLVNLAIEAHWNLQPNEMTEFHGKLQKVLESYGNKSEAVYAGLKREAKQYGLNKQQVMLFAKKTKEVYQPGNDLRVVKAAREVKIPIDFKGCYKNVKHMRHELRRAVKLGKDIGWPEVEIAQFCAAARFEELFEAYLEKGDDGTFTYVGLHKGKTSGRCKFVSAFDPDLVNELLDNVREFLSTKSVDAAVKAYYRHIKKAHPAESQARKLPRKAAALMTADALHKKDPTVDMTLIRLLVLHKDTHLYTNNIRPYC